VVAFLGGYAFGFIAGGVLALLATVTGCALTFYYARGMGRRLVQHRFAGRIRKIDVFLKQNTFSMAMVIHLLPVGSNAINNLLAGVSSVRGLPYFAGSGLGYLPQTVVFALAGSGVTFDPVLPLTLAVVLFAVSGLIGVWLFRRHWLVKVEENALKDGIDTPLGDTVAAPDTACNARIE